MQSKLVTTRQRKNANIAALGVYSQMNNYVDLMDRTEGYARFTVIYNALRARCCVGYFYVRVVEFLFAFQIVLFGVSCIQQL